MRKYDSYKDSGVEWIGEIPSGWDCDRIKNHFNHISEKIKPEDDDKKISSEDVDSFFGKINNFYSRYGILGVKFNPGDVLFNKLGVKVHKLFHSTFEGFSMGELIVLRNRSKDTFNSKFLYYQLTRTEVIDLCKKISNGVTLKRVSVDDLMNLYITYPPLKFNKKSFFFLMKISY
ncbi:MAG: restriction endonuclease subunit S [Flavobacteriaceae bacterium]|nr:restriction endonuclease subunit S [Flavobacteriaceae bacterium]